MREVRAPLLAHTPLLKSISLSKAVFFMSNNKM
jgi:hypothetical protein